VAAVPAFAAPPSSWLRACSSWPGPLACGHPKLGSRDRGCPIPVRPARRTGSSWPGHPWRQTESAPRARRCPGRGTAWLRVRYRPWSCRCGWRTRRSQASPPRRTERQGTVPGLRSRRSPAGRLSPGRRYDGGNLLADVLAHGREVSRRMAGVGGVGEISVVRPEDRPHHGMARAVNLPPAAGVGGEFRGTPDTDAGPGVEVACWWETSSTIDSTVVPAKLFFALSGRHAARSGAVPFFTAALTIPSSDRSM